jgi:hypothetical protein
LHQIKCKSSFTNNDHSGGEEIRPGKSILHLVNKDVQNNYYPSDADTSVDEVLKRDCNLMTAKKECSYEKVWKIKNGAEDIDFKRIVERKSSRNSNHVHAHTAPENSSEYPISCPTKYFHHPSYFGEKIATHSSVTSHNYHIHDGSYHGFHDRGISPSGRDFDKPLGETQMVLRKGYPNELKGLESPNLKNTADSLVKIFNQGLQMSGKCSSDNDVKCTQGKGGIFNVKNHSNHAPLNSKTLSLNKHNKSKDLKLTSNEKFGETVKYGQRILSVNSIASTCYEIQQGRAILIQCPCCFCVLQVPTKAKLVICVKCETISPVKNCISQGDDLKLAKTIQYEEILDSSRKDPNSDIK